METRSGYSWAALTALFGAEVIVCSGIEAAALDQLVRRPETGGGSITTLLPGLVYASATVMKVCLIVVVILLAAGLLWQVTAGRGARRSTVGAIAALAAQALQNLGGVPLAEQFAGMAQSGVFVMMAGLLLGAVAGIVSLVRRQGVWFPLCGVVTSVALLALFAYFRFHASGFDQDRWVPTMAGL